VDAYFRGNSQEVAFFKKLRFGENHVVVATASGEAIGNAGVKLRTIDLRPLLAQYARLPKEQRQPVLEDPATATPPQRPLPEPPANGLIVRGYCTYLRQDPEQRFHRTREYYYRENPDRWPAETQSDMLWLTEDEWKSLIPSAPKVGAKHDVRPGIQKRFYGTLGIDYAEGSVSSQPLRASTMTLTVTQVDAARLVMRLDGHADLGKVLDKKPGQPPTSAGSELRVLGYVDFDRGRQVIVRFDVVGAGRAWGHRGEVRLDENPWPYGIAWELVTTRNPVDCIPPYNLVHYNVTGPYFEKP
jgi:hypothetical protein